MMIKKGITANTDYSTAALCKGSFLRPILDFANSYLLRTTRESENPLSDFLGETVLLPLGKESPVYFPLAKMQTGSNPI